MNAERVVFLLAGIVMSLFVALKTYVAIKRPNIGPEMMTDAMLFALGATVCFWVSRHGWKKPSKPD